MVSSNTNQIKKAIVFIANGTEEMEAIITMMFCAEQVSNRNVRIVPDAYLGDDSVKISTYDAVIIPGGAEGAATLPRTRSLAIKSAGIQSKVPHPICLTSHPSVKDQLKNDFVYKEDRVVVDSNLFALRLVSLLVDEDKAREVAGPMMLNFEI
ncbi:hypothetical protein BX661DRAFT_197538 [Kickxella alabastrina]|uniref:uncharacterized protein n=1 Tax=Kickxella alabastrina TaxID=61397 RepID=UPI00221E96D1|nr:uncharacterized protein BX661DRAFT_197538 [Kickxella alabastrina]KAI7831000.1 hypothetical protein BX661DRAFT_197538 [Kickxella alabastrina]